MTVRLIKRLAFAVAKNTCHNVSFLNSNFRSFPQGTIFSHFYQKFFLFLTELITGETKK